MKYTIFGFRQIEAVKMDLTNDDLLLLRWFVDFKECGKMDRKYNEDRNNMGYWVNYTNVINELPIIFKSKSMEANKKKLQRMLAGNLSKVITRDFEASQPTEYVDGKPVYRGGKMYLALIPETYDLLINGSGQDCIGGSSQDCIGGLDNVDHANSSTINSSTNDSSTRKIREGEPSFPVLSDATKSDVISLEDKNDMKDKPTPAIIPNECINDLDKFFIGRLKKERAFYGINFDKEPYYDAFADALLKTQLQDSVEVLTMTQYPYFIKTLKNMIEPLETERKLLGW